MGYVRRGPIDAGDNRLGVSLELVGELSGRELGFALAQRDGENTRNVRAIREINVGIIMYRGQRIVYIHLRSHRSAADGLRGAGAADPGAQDVDAGSPDVDTGTKVAEGSLDIPGVDGADGVGGSDVAGAGSGGVLVIVSGGDGKVDTLGNALRCKNVRFGLG